VELLYATVVAILAGSGLFLLLRARSFPVVMGLLLFSYAVNLFLVSMGRLHTGRPAIIAEGAQYTDPLPQALVLTAIVIGFAMISFITVLALRARSELGNDHVDARSDEEQQP
jgi:multicomponent K+:H+ antiporter subunit C